MSGQLEAETYACALGRVYTFGPTFRAENSNTRRHLAEFWMIEPEMAFADLADDAALAEDYVRYLCRYVLDHCAEDLAFFDQRVQPGLVAMLEAVAGSAFHRLTYTEAVALLEKADAPFEFPVAWGGDLQSEHERYLTENVFGRPVIVTDFPLDFKAFYMRLNDDGRPSPPWTCWCRHRRDRRRQPARGAPRRAPRQRPAARASTPTTTGGTPTCAATAPCPTPGSAWASSAWSSSAPACRTSATSSPSRGPRAAPTSEARAAPAQRHSVNQDPRRGPRTPQRFRRAGSGAPRTGCGALQSAISVEGQRLTLT